MRDPRSPLFVAFLPLLCGGMGWWAGSAKPSETWVAFVSVGQGDCTVFSSNGYTILIDDGPESPTSNSALSITLPWLDHHGVQNVSYILLSHPDQDHVGGTPAILARFKEARILISDQFKDDAEMSKRLEEWNVSPASITWLPKYSSMNVGEAHLEMECPDRPAGGDANDGSMFVRISDQNGSVTLSGDAPKSVERIVAHDESWQSEILHVGHHGSHTATDQVWLDTVKPQYAIVSVGRNNRYGHPSQETLDRLDRNHIAYFRTDRDGTVTFEMKGGTFQPVQF